MKKDIFSLSLKENNDIEHSVSCYNKSVLSICDTHIPTVNRRIKIRPNRKWYSQLLRDERTKRRRLERKKNKSGSQKDKDIYVSQCEYYNYLCNEAKTQFLSQSIIDTSADKRKLFAVAKDILNWRERTLLPEDTLNLTERFAEYFVDKIVKIQSDISDKQESIADLCALRSEIQQFSTSSRLSSFEPTTVDEICKIVKSMSNATCDLDPIPTDLLKECLSEIAPQLCRIVNLSLQSAHIPKELKISLVKPLLKKKTLDPDNYKNYRPVSNLSFLSKVIEKIVCTRLETYLENNSLFPIMQSAYRKKHSTETAILKIVNDILNNMDKGKMSAIILLDLSSAFDTIHHGLLLTRLKERFNIDGSALKWIESYLTDRKQRVCLPGFPDSAARSLEWGVPQGSILGPLLFSLYTAPLGDIARKYGLDHHFYADDAQVYNTIENAKSEDDLQNCVNAYREWMIANYLKVNDDKTELLLIGSPHNVRISNTQYLIFCW